MAHHTSPSAVPPRKRTANQFGRRAEWRVAWCLRLKGYRILARGTVHGRRTGAGEIDIIARRNNLMVFVEVKARRDAGQEVVSPHQQQRITRAAAFYLANKPEFASDAVRFDVAIVQPWKLPHFIENAWEA